MKGFAGWLLAAALAIPWASAQTLLELSAGRPSLDAQALVVERGLGTEVDFTEDLGMEQDTVALGRLTHWGRRGFVCLAWEQASFAGDEVVQRTIYYSGQPYRVGTRVKSELAMERGVLQAAWQFLATPGGRVAFGPMVEVVGLRARGQLDAPQGTPPVSESGTFQAVAPVPGLALDLRPGARVRLFARAAGLRLSQGSYDSGEVGVVLGPFGPLALAGGYRLLKVRVEDEPDFVRLRLDGPYLSVALAF
ncbi:MAG: hypothetical protein N2447_00790 [Thermoanaerobaculum sp.]|nr:hypothetical protein [Thermoanaerobaculum sp.]